MIAAALWYSIIESWSFSRRSSFFFKNGTIFHTGDLIHEIGIIESGSVNIENIDLLGNKSILSNISQGQIFAETYAICHEPMLVDVVAIEDTQVLFADLDILLSNRYASQPWHAKIMQNILKLSVQKNLVLSNRIFCTSAKTIRSRLLTYLSMESVKAGNTTFQIPFDRQQLADYLNVDRTALSKELGKMRTDGILDFYKNKFTLRSFWIPDWPLHKLFLCFFLFRDTFPAIF